MPVFVYKHIKIVKLTTVKPGSDGMLEVIPVFLDHILHPTLRPAQFLTEVYHMDGTAKHQGVVYCEMASRENTEPDLLDHALRRLLYQNQTTYACETGGRTSDILNLTNEEIIAYHQKFYHLDNLTAIICGQIDPEALFGKLAATEGLLERGAGDGSADIPVIACPRLPGKGGEFVSETVRFPSSDEDVGSIAFGWRGPPSEDMFTIVALDVLFRYLHETSASPFAQAFVERPDPYASQVDVELKGFVETSIVLIFSGVPYPGNDANAKEESEDGKDHIQSDSEDVEMAESDAGNGSEWEDMTDESGDEDESDEDSDEDMDDAHPPRKDLFDAGVYRDLMMTVLRDFAFMTSPPADLMHATLRRHRRKIKEALEEDPHDNIAAYLIPDIVRHHLAASSTLNDTRAQGGNPRIGTRDQMFEVLDRLQKEDGQFWCDLARRWVVDAPGVEVLMVPDMKMAEENSRREHEEQKARAQALGPEGLAALKKQVDDAMEDNKIDLPPDLIAKMGPVPDVTKAPRLP
ncbi:hypothetical protein HK104_004459, partial [Borealophlyctis nickersoniae]